MLQCSHCTKEFKYESEKKRHEQSHVPQFECSDCLKKFSFLSALRRHQKQHKRTGSVQCSECRRNFRDNTLLIRHIKYAHKGTHICPKCNGVFNSKLALSCHLKTHKPKSERVFKCNYSDCNKTFNFLHHLKHHELTHSKSKEYFCNTCGRGFIQAHHLKTHLKTHEPENWLPCTFHNCKKTFPTHYALKRHFATHDVVLCSSCGQLVSCASYDKHVSKCVYPSDAKGLSNSELQILDNYCENSTINNNKPLPSDLEHLSSQTNALINKCDGCSCMASDNCDLDSNSLKPLSLHNFSSSDDFLKFEYKIDGTIKLTDTTDIDFEVKSETPKNERNILDNYSFEKLLVPYNSCKDILGKCIVSGNGIISEECLCAKMAMDDQQIIAQEIDEITPKPIQLS